MPAPSSRAFIEETMRLHQAGHLEAAAQRYAAGLKHWPTDSDLHHLLGLAQYQLGRFEAAIASISQAIVTSRSDQPQFHFNLGRIYREHGQPDAACAEYEKAVSIDPGHAHAWANLSSTLGNLGRYDEATKAGRRALRLNAHDTIALNATARALAHLCHVEEARALYQRAWAVSGNPADRLKAALVTSPVPGSGNAILEDRQQLMTELEALAHSDGEISNPLTAIGSTYFYYSYHGICNRELNGQIARVLEKFCPSLHFMAGHCRGYQGPGERIRVGFISKFMHNHSIGRTTEGLVSQLDRERFEVHALFATRPPDDPISRRIAATADAYVILPENIEQAHRLIAERELDILFYQDIGMEPMTYMLAFARLAPVQCVSFGHPDTTGIPNMDWFISSALFEPGDAQEHYTERLHLVEGAGTLAYYAKPTLPEQLKSRQEFNLPESSPLYLCPQTLFKFHPEFDDLIAGILERDPAGYLVIVTGSVETWVDALLERLAGRLPGARERVVVLPRLSSADFLNVISLAEVMLDTIHFNGMNTSLEAFAVGTPVVTMPTEMQRGRHTSGMYRAMGLDDLVAGTPDEYISLAVDLATDAVLREQCRERILASNDCLYENRGIVRGFEEFFLQAVKLVDD